MAEEYAIDSGWLVELVDEHTCGAGADGWPHEPTCGMIPVVSLEHLFRLAKAEVEEPKAVADTRDERARQDAKWGEQNHPDGTGPESMPLADFPYRQAFKVGGRVHTAPAWVLAAAATEVTDVSAKSGNVTWADILLEEVFEAFAEQDPVKLRTELIQVAAVAQQWVEAIDRRSAVS